MALSSCFQRYVKPVNPHLPKIVAYNQSSDILKQNLLIMSIFGYKTGTKRHKQTVKNAESYGSILTQSNYVCVIKVTAKRNADSFCHSITSQN